MIKSLRSNYLLSVLLWAAFLLVFAYAWVPGGLDTDSCNYAVVAKEIVRSHKWLNLQDPVYGGVFYYHFPLCIWVTAGFFIYLGVSTFAAKLFSMLCAAALVVLLYYFGKLLKNEWVGFFAGMSLLMTNHIVRLSRQCRMDIPVTLFISLAMFSFILAQKRSRRYYLLFGLFTALAIMSKDIFGLAPLAIVCAYFFIRRDWKEILHPFFLLGLLTAALPVALWIWLDHGVLVNCWYRWNFLHLYKSSSFHVPWYYYIWTLVTKYFYFLPIAVYGGYLVIKEAREQRNYLVSVLIIWAIIFPLAFSFGRQKLHYFILPMYPAASLLAAVALEKIFSLRVKKAIAGALKYILVAASIIMLCLPLRIESKRFVESVRLAPLLDEVLKQLPEYEFMIYKQDSAAILFYSRQLSALKILSDKQSLEESLSLNDKLRVYYLSKNDFFALDADIVKKCRVILQYDDKIIVVNQKDFLPHIILPSA